MKSMVIFVVLLILFSNVYAAENVDIPETFETGEKAVSDETTYFYAGSKLLASKDSSGVNYHYQDRLGSDVDSKSLPFGQSLKVGERFSFTGKELDEDLYYFNARYYDSSLGRFTSVDPVKGELAYGYVMNNPLMFVDPDGMQSYAQPDNTRVSGQYSDYLQVESKEFMEVSFDPITGEYRGSGWETEYSNGLQNFEYAPVPALEPQDLGLKFALGFGLAKGASLVRSLAGVAEVAGLPDPRDALRSVGVFRELTEELPLRQMWNLADRNFNNFGAINVDGKLVNYVGDIIPGSHIRVIRNPMLDQGRSLVPTPEELEIIFSGGNTRFITSFATMGGDEITYTITKSGTNVYSVFFESAKKGKRIGEAFHRSADNLQELREIFIEEFVFDIPEAKKPF